MDKRAFEFSFSWIFTVIVGAVIIFLAIFAATRLTDTLRAGQEAVGGKTLSVLLTPIETSLEEAKLTEISVTSETKITNLCYDSGTFGRQDISISIKSGIGESEWRPQQAAPSSFYNKYIFSSISPETHAENTFYALSKPFYYPFKIADIVIVWGDKQNFCFILPETGAPYTQIRKDVEDLNLDEANIELQTQVASCKPESQTVCFSSGETACDIVVSTNTQTIKKNDILMNYPESFAPSGSSDKYVLMYAAIFSDPTNYDCQIQRIFGRAATLAELLKQKSTFLSAEPYPRGCGSQQLQTPLSLYSSNARSIESSSDVAGLQSLAQQLNNLNYGQGGSSGLRCKLF